MCDTLLVRCPDAGAADRDLRSDVGRLAGSSAVTIERTRAYRALQDSEIYAYFELAQPRELGADDRDGFAAAARGFPALPAGALSVARLQRMFEPAAASAGQPAPFHYVVEMDPADGWRDELLRWYDTEHMPGLAAVAGCVRAQRFVNHDHGPWSLACYDLVRPETTAAPDWLAVRATAWSDRVRPQFRNPKRTMVRSVY